MNLVNIKSGLVVIALSLLISLTVFAQIENTDTSEPNLIIFYFTKEGVLTNQKEGSEYYRKLLEVQEDGAHLIQDFYTDNNQKQTDPVLMFDGNALDTWDPNNFQGPLIFWSKTGHKMAQYYYKDGKKEGRQTNWDEQGNKKAEISFHNDRPNGPYTVWHDNGNKKREGLMKEGKKTGLQTQWRENGEKEAIGEMLDDEYEGIWTIWDKKGVQKEVHFSKGKTISN